MTLARFIAFLSLVAMTLSSCNNPKKDQEHFQPTPGGEGCEEEADY